MSRDRVCSLAHRHAAQRTRTIAALMEDWSVQRFTVTKCETEHGYHIPIAPDFLAAHGGWTHRDTHAVRVRVDAPGPDRESTGRLAMRSPSPIRRKPAATPLKS